VPFGRWQEEGVGRESELAREEKSKAHERESQRPLKRREGGQGNEKEEGRGKGFGWGVFSPRNRTKREEKRSEKGIASKVIHMKGDSGTAVCGLQQEDSIEWESGHACLCEKQSTHAKDKARDRRKKPREGREENERERGKEGW